MEYQVHLNFRNMCQRGVRLREIPPDELLEYEDEAVQLAQAGNTAPSLQKIQRLIQMRGALHMITEITEPLETSAEAATQFLKDSAEALKNGTAPPPPLESPLDSAKWIPISYADLTQETSPLHYKRIFSARDMHYLERIWKQLHELDYTEVQMVAGKAGLRPIAASQPSTGRKEPTTGR